MSNVPFGSQRCRSSASSQTHLTHVSALSGPQSLSPSRGTAVSGRFVHDPGRRGPDCGRGVPVAFRRTGIGFLGHPVPAGELSLPHGRPTSPPKRPGPRRGSTFHTHEQRPGWVPSRPRGRRCPRDRYGILRSPPAASQRHGPCTPVPLPPSGAQRNEASSRVHSCSPVRSSPCLWPPGGARALGLLPGASHPAVTSDARPGGDRPWAQARDYAADTIICRPSFLRVHS